MSINTSEKSDREGVNTNTAGNGNPHQEGSTSKFVEGQQKATKESDADMAEPTEEMQKDIEMGEAISKEKETAPPQQAASTPLHMNQQTRCQISYKAKLMGEEEKTLDQDFDKLVKEWLQEEQDLSPQLSEDQRKLVESIPKISISDERLKEMCKPWKDALILTLLGRQTNLNMMKDRVSWMLKSENFEIIDLPNNYFVFRTTDKSLTSKLLFDGPWVIQGHYLAVQRWSPNFNPYSNKRSKVAIWVRVPTLPIHLYTEEFMLELGNMVGKALKVDLNTLAQKDNKLNEVSRAKFARVSVEVDLNKQLKSKFRIRTQLYTVEYEGLNKICFKCGT